MLLESNAFEDEPMPTLRGIVGEEQVRILIDSGAAISLMTKTLADKLCKKGHKTKGVNIKVAIEWIVGLSTQLDTNSGCSYKNTNTRWRIISLDGAHFQNTKTLHAPARNDIF